MYFDTQRERPDVFFVRKLNQVTTPTEVKNIIGILDEEHTLTDRENEVIEKFFYKLQNKIGTLSDTVVEFCGTFDVDLAFLLQKNKRILRKVKVEKRLNFNENIEDFF